MFGIYTSLYSLEGIDYEDALLNFCYFAGQDGQIQVAIPTDDKEGIYDILYKWKELHHPFSVNLELFHYRIDCDNPDIKQILKNAALQEVCKDICVALDFNERIPLWQRDRWVELGEVLQQTDHAAVFIPFIDLTTDFKHFIGINQKWYIHKKKDAFIGAPKYAIKEDGSVDRTQTNGMDLINGEGKIFDTVMLCNYYTPEFFMENNIPFVYGLSGKDADENSKEISLDLWK